MCVGGVLALAIDPSSVWAINIGDLANGQYWLRITSAKPETLYVLPLSKHSH